MFPILYKQSYAEYVYHFVVLFQEIGKSWEDIQSEEDGDLTQDNRGEDRYALAVLFN